MFKKIALCAMLVLILAPAAVMAAGQQEQAPGIGKEAGNCLNVQQQIASDAASQEKSQNGQDQSSGGASQNGNAQMLQTRSSEQTGDQDKAMIRNMTRDQIQQGSNSGIAGESRGTGSNGDARMLQIHSSDQTGDQDKAMVRNMTRDQIRLSSDPVKQQNGSADSVQNQFGITKGNGQNILTGFADHLGAQFRNMTGIFQTLVQ